MSEHRPVVVAAGVVFRGNEILVARRRKSSHLELQWEFPGGKLELDESPEECLAREFQEELGARVEVGRILEVVHHRYPDRTVLLLFYACRLIHGQPRPIGCEELVWLERKDLLELDWVPADLAFVRRLAASTPELSNRSPESRLK